MDHIGAAILLAQPVVDRAGIEQHGPAIAQRIGRLQQRVGRQIGDDEAIAVGEGGCGLGDILAILEPNLLQGEALIEELAGGVVVLDREARAGDAVILGRVARRGTIST